MEQDQNLGSGDGFVNQSIESSKTQKNISSFHQLMRRALISISYQVVITIITLYSLFADDVRIVAFESSADLTFDILNIIILFCFTIQVVISSIVIQKYFCSFFFILDVVSTISILFDVSLLTNLVYASSFSSYNFSQIASQSKATRAAVRAIRIVKLFRIIRIIKIYKSALNTEQVNDKKMKKTKENKNKIKKQENEVSHDQNTLQKMKIIQNKGLMFNEKKIYPQEVIESTPSPNLSLPHYSEQRSFQNQDRIKQVIKEESIIDNIQAIDANQSKIRKLLNDVTMKKVILVVLTLVLLVPLFSYDVYVDPANSFDYTCDQVAHMLATNDSSMTVSLISGFAQYAIDRQISDYQNIIYFSTPFNQLPHYKVTNFEKIRVSDLTPSTTNIDTASILLLRPDLTLRADSFSNQKTIILAIVNQGNYNADQSALSIGRTIFICIVLILLLHFFNKDIEDLIVHPIEDMMKKLLQMAKDPELAAKQQINPNIQFQTTIVSNAIIKIGALLSIVFGSAGAQIIGKNIVQEGDMNPMIEGKKKCAIFGFCDIRHFSQVTEQLQQDILKFVNKISSVVHKAVYRYGGSANKNIGEAFLLVWKIPDTDYAIDNSNNQITWKNKKYLSVLADFSVYSFIKTLIKINKLPQILEYKKDYRLAQKILDFKVQMGFGLHIGWAIEGAIGSQYKIDASYLSPNVNMASRLQAATKQFGVDLLISQDLYEVLTPGMQTFCRNIDRVTVKGSNKPIKLYTIDLNLQNISPSADKTLKYPDNPDYQPDIDLKREQNMSILQSEQTIQEYDAKKFVLGKKQLREVMIEAVKPEFKKRFQEGLTSYLQGKWADAKLHLTNASKIQGRDGPTKRLLSYMKSYDFIAPNTWKNYRQLTSK